MDDSNQHKSGNQGHGRDGRFESPVTILLKAEEIANAIVSAAKERRARLLKRAKDDARAEIAAYREQHEAKLHGKIAQAEEGRGEAHEILEAEANKKIDSLKSDAAERENEIRSWLVSLALGL